MKNRIHTITAIGLAGMMAFGATAEAATFSNTAAIAIPETGTSGAADPFPSTIDVSGSGIITSLTVSLLGLSHTWPDDIIIGLSGPTGTGVFLMSDAGSGFDVNGVDLTFDDAAPTALPDSNQIVSGSYQVSQFGNQEVFPAPAPAFAFGSSLSDFVGTDANGTWSLFVFDDAGADTGSIAGGWALNIETSTVAPVPLPASLPLLLAGLGAVGMMRRRKRA